MKTKKQKLTEELNLLVRAQTDLESSLYAINLFAKFAIKNNLYTNIIRAEDVSVNITNTLSDVDTMILEIQTLISKI